MKVTVIGTGYVGLTTALTLAAVGHTVVGVDKDPRKLQLLRSGRSPIHEEGMDELLALVKPRVQFTDDTASAVKDSDVIMIAVGTPPKPSGEADTTFVEAAAIEVAEHLPAGRTAVIVVKSTVPIGTNKRVTHLMKKVLRERQVEATVHLASNPEFLREGRALPDSFYPDRIVLGTLAADAEDRLYRLYKPLLEQSFNPPQFLPRPEKLPRPSLITTNPTSAEISKYASNAFLATKISFINEMAGLCERVGADIVQVSRVMGLDHRIGPHFLNAGIGWGGSCFPKDTTALQAVAAEYGYEMPIIEAARQINLRQRQAILDKLQDELKVLRGQVIGVLGLAFKPGTDDIRDSAATALCEMLIERGASIRATDPIALENARNAFSGQDGIEFFDDTYEAMENCDAILLATEWPEYTELDLTRLAESLAQPVLIDGRNALDAEVAQLAGLRYRGVGHSG